MNWTPGPWEFLADEWNTGGVSESAIEDHRSHSRGSIVAPRRNLTFEESPWFVATMENAPEQEYNACLIAAAPDLYEALGDLLELMDNSAPWPVVWTLKNKAYAALAKARGKAIPKKESA